VPEGLQVPKYVIEREIPGIGGSDQDQLAAIAKKSNFALTSLGPKIQWVCTYIVDNKTYCVYIAPDERMIREHARLSGFPANTIREIKATIDPATAETR
jgi:hypothetical protein